MQTRDDEISADIQAPLGWRARINGVGSRELLVVIIIIGCFMALWYASEQREARFALAHTITQKMLAEQNVILGQIVVNQGSIIKTTQEGTAVNSEKLDDMTFILTLTQLGREQLKLSMPPSLRKKINGR